MENNVRQLILNNCLQGIDVGNSNDAILAAMDEYAEFKIKDLKRYIESRKTAVLELIDETVRRKEAEIIIKLLLDTNLDSQIYNEVHKYYLKYDL